MGLLTVRHWTISQHYVSFSKIH